MNQNLETLLLTLRTYLSSHPVEAVEFFAIYDSFDLSNLAERSISDHPRAIPRNFSNQKINKFIEHTSTTLPTLATQADERYSLPARAHPQKPLAKRRSTVKL